MTQGSWGCVREGHLDVVIPILLTSHRVLQMTILASRKLTDAPAGRPRRLR